MTIHPPVPIQFYIEDDLAELQARPCKNSRPGLQDMEWGQREMVVYDGFGNRLIFCRLLAKS